MSACGPSRHFVAAQQFSRFRCRADITRLAADMTPVANEHEVVVELQVGADHVGAELALAVFARMRKVTGQAEAT